MVFPTTCAFVYVDESEEFDRPPKENGPHPIDPPPDVLELYVVFKLELHPPVSVTLRASKIAVGTKGMNPVGVCPLAASAPSEMFLSADPSGAEFSQRHARD